VGREDAGAGFRGKGTTTRGAATRDTGRAQGATRGEGTGTGGFRGKGTTVRGAVTRDTARGEGSASGATRGKRVSPAGTTGARPPRAKKAHRK
jgi:hypothetical protein